MEFEHKTLFIDIETTGLIPEILVDGKRPGTKKKQQIPYDAGYNQYPHIVSMAWKIDNNDPVEYIFNQEGRDIPKESSDIHGITAEIASKSKFVFSDAILEMFGGEVTCFDVDIVVGHGLYFDTSIIKANILREIDRGRLEPEDFDNITEILHKNKRIDTMRSSAKLMRGWATLSELHMKLFRKGFKAHVAREDVEACFRCYCWLSKKGIVPSYEELLIKAEERNNVE